MKEAVQRLIRNIKVPACLLVYGGLSTGRGEDEGEADGDKATTPREEFVCCCCGAVCGLSEREEVGEKHAQLSYERREGGGTGGGRYTIRTVGTRRLSTARQVGDRLSDGVTT